MYATSLHWHLVNLENNFFLNVVFFKRVFGEKPEMKSVVNKIQDIFMFHFTT